MRHTEIDRLMRPIVEAIAAWGRAVDREPLPEQRETFALAWGRLCVIQGLARGRIEVRLLQLLGEHAGACREAFERVAPPQPLGERVLEVVTRMLRDPDSALTEAQRLIAVAAHGKSAMRTPLGPGGVPRPGDVPPWAWPDWRRGVVSEIRALLEHEVNDACVLRLQQMLRWASAVGEEREVPRA